MSFRYHLKGLKKRSLQIYKKSQLKGAKELKIYVKKDTLKSLLSKTLYLFDLYAFCAKL